MDYGYQEGSQGLTLIGGVLGPHGPQEQTLSHTGAHTPSVLLANPMAQREQMGLMGPPQGTC